MFRIIISSDLIGTTMQIAVSMRAGVCVRMRVPLFVCASHVVVLGNARYVK